MASFSARGVCDSNSGGKFWEIEVSGSSFTTTFGKVGERGASNTKEWDSEAKALAEAQKLVKQKEKKGYEMDGGAAAPPKAKKKSAPVKKTIEKKKPAAAKKQKKPSAKRKGDGPDFQRRYVCDSNSGGKFWEVQVSGSEMITIYGKVGTSGASTTKDFSDEAAAMKEAEKLVKQKEKKGYEME